MIIKLKRFEYKKSLEDAMKRVAKKLLKDTKLKYKTIKIKVEKGMTLEVDLDRYTITLISNNLVQIGDYHFTLTDKEYGKIATHFNVVEINGESISIEDIVKVYKTTYIDSSTSYYTVETNGRNFGISKEKYNELMEIIKC